MKINLKTILFYLTIVALLTPFFVDIQSYFPFIIGKATAFRIIVGLMLLIWSLWMFGSRHSEKKFIFSANSLIKAVILFGVIVFISALFGVNFYYSFFSGNERMEGVLGIWYFISFFLIIATVFDYLEIEKILKAQIFISLFYSFLSLLFFLGIAQVFVKVTSNRLIGYTGNPSFFAVYLLFNAFLALYVYFRQYNFDKKLFNWWLIPFFIQSLLLFATLTRGSMMGYLVSIILIALAIIFLSKDKIILPLKKIAIVFLISITALSIFTFAGKNTDFVKNNQILSRFSSISLTDPTAKSRIFSAGTAWKSFLQKPLFGWGQENYEAAYTTNFNPEVLKHLPEDFYFDRAHNKPMEVLATNGIFGFLSYLSIFGIAFYFLNKLRKKQEWFLPSLALGGCLIGYFVQNIFIFDFHESYLMFFLVLGFIASLSSVAFSPSSKDSLAMVNEDNHDKKAQLDYASKMGKTLIIIMVFCLVLFSTVKWVIEPYLVSKKIIKIGSFMRQEQGEEAFRELRKAINNPAFLKDDIIIGVKKLYTSYSSKIEKEDKKNIIEILVLEAEEAVQKKPWRFGLMTIKGDLETMYSQWDKTYIDKAKETTETIISRFPYFPQGHLFASKFYLLNGEIEKSIEAAQKVIEIDPKISTTYYLLSTAYNELDDAENRNENLIKAAKLNYPFNDKDQILFIINLLVKEKDYSTIEKLYLRAIQIDSHDLSLYTSLAATYAKIQNKDKAIEYAKKAVELNPAAQEAAEEFIQLVEDEQWEMVGD
jgi:O-antigen ligase